MPIPGLASVSDDALFPYLNLVLLGWGLLVFAPHWRHTQAAVLTICGQGLNYMRSLHSST